MIYKKYSLSEFSENKLKSSCEVSLTAFIPENFSEMNLDRKRKALIVCPGGGYRFVSDREAEPIAIKFMSYDMAVFVLKYSIAPEIYPKATLELAAAINFIKNNSEYFSIDKDAISVMGFSAGGHLAGTISVMANTEKYAQILGLSVSDITPANAVLCYSVISTDREICNSYTFENLFGRADFDNSLSLEKLVNEKTLPTFIWTTKTDRTVNYLNSVVFADALQKYNIPHRLKIFDSGVHGLALSNEITQIKGRPETVNKEVMIWPELCMENLRNFYNKGDTV